jgi:hypothetical protein
MTDIKSARHYFGYVSAYLTRPTRSLAEAERDREAAQEPPDQEAEPQIDAKAARAGEPRS